MATLRTVTSLVFKVLLFLTLFDYGECFQFRGPAFAHQDEFRRNDWKQQRLDNSLVRRSQPGNSFPEIERPEPSILLSTQDDSTQRLGVISIGAGILGGTFVITNFLFWLQNLLPAGFFDTIIDFTVPVPLGFLYIALGVTHFVYKDGYAAIVPPNGSWGGLWNVPTPGANELGLSNEEYHVLWTGVTEIGGGLLFVLGGLNAVPIQIPAFLLFLLTLAITPANIYMFTHDAQMSFAPPIPYPVGHFGRGVLQCILLSLFWFFVFQ